MEGKKLIGPFSQIIPLTDLPLKGAVSDDQLHIISDGGVLVKEGKILSVGSFAELAKSVSAHTAMEEIQNPKVLLPGFIDCHTHICFAGSRSRDYALRTGGSSYQEILQQGGGIHETVARTRETTENELVQGIIQRANRHLREGVTTIEVKSGYGLSTSEELKMLMAIRSANNALLPDLIATCLAAHVKPKEFKEAAQYLEYLVEDLLPLIKKDGISDRIDIFIEPEAFSPEIARVYLQKAQQSGFLLCIHADQFTAGGSKLAVELSALSADHLEASGEEEIRLLAKSATVATVLPGASLGLGMAFAPARKLLDAGACVAIATDWNPGSAPMGDLLLQAAVLGASEKLSMAEVFAGITTRAAAALQLSDRGQIGRGMLADFQAFPTNDYREILYFQGKMKAAGVWKKGRKVMSG